MRGGNAGNLRRATPLHAAHGIRSSGHHEFDDLSTDGSAFTVNRPQMSGRSSSTGTSAWTASVNRMQAEQHLADLRRAIELEQARVAELVREREEQQSRFEAQLRNVSQERDVAVSANRNIESDLLAQIEDLKELQQCTDARATAAESNAEQLARDKRELSATLSAHVAALDAEKQVSATLQQRLSDAELAATTAQDKLAELSEAHQHRAALVRELLACLRDTDAAVGAAAVAAGHILARGDNSFDVGSESRAADYVEF
jgi:chromosome segregation ATPase